MAGGAKDGSKNGKPYFQTLWRVQEKAIFLIMRPLSSILLRFVLATSLLTASLAVLPWHAAYAQSADEAEAEQEAMDAQKQAEARKEARKSAPPSALPGAESDEADTSHARVDINPTAALFDAINRGSIIGVKEAVNRGADTNAHNVLDQTPLDLAIDLGRNDIMFQLLSLRTYNPDGQLFTDSTHDDITTQDGIGHLSIHGQTGITALAPKAPLAEDRGQPNPAIGFLGFEGPATVASKPSPTAHHLGGPKRAAQYHIAPSHHGTAKQQTLHHQHMATTTPREH